MGERTEHAPGTFSWTDLTTTDQEGAKGFYTALLGWEVEDMPAGDGMIYSMARVDGKYVAAISPQPEAMREMGAPPAWNSYVTVASADAATERAAGLGATLLGPPFDVFDSGRMAVVQDPQRAAFMVWEPREHIGAQLVNAPGALVWNELASPDAGASAKFYGDLFGWGTEPSEGSPDVYLTIQNDGKRNGGIRPCQPGEPPYWLSYFGVGDLDGALDEVQQLGGTKLLDPIDIQVGRIGVAQDPQGAVFALYAGEFDD